MFFSICLNLIDNILFQRDTKTLCLDLSLHCIVKLIILYGFLRMSCK